VKRAHLSRSSTSSSALSRTKDTQRGTNEPRWHTHKSGTHTPIVSQTHNQLVTTAASHIQVPRMVQCPPPPRGESGRSAHVLVTHVDQLEHLLRLGLGAQCGDDVELREKLQVSSKVQLAGGRRVTCIPDQPYSSKGYMRGVTLAIVGFTKKYGNGNHWQRKRPIL
jgi:hypothetical protein